MQTVTEAQAFAIGEAAERLAGRGDTYPNPFTPLTPLAERFDEGRTCERTRIASLPRTDAANDDDTRAVEALAGMYSIAAWGTAAEPWIGFTYDAPSAPFAPLAPGKPSAVTTWRIVDGARVLVGTARAQSGTTNAHALRTAPPSQRAHRAASQAERAPIASHVLSAGAFDALARARAVVDAPSTRD